MATKSAIVEIPVMFKVYLNKYGEVSSVEPMRAMSKVFDEAAQTALDMDDFEMEDE